MARDRADLVRWRRRRAEIYRGAAALIDGIQRNDARPPRGMFVLLGRSCECARVLETKDPGPLIPPGDVSRAATFVLSERLLSCFASRSVAREHVRIHVPDCLE